MFLLLGALKQDVNTILTYCQLKSYYGKHISKVLTILQIQQTWSSINIYLESCFWPPDKLKSNIKFLIVPFFLQPGCNLLTLPCFPRMKEKLPFLQKSKKPYLEAVFSLSVLGYCRNIEVQHGKGILQGKMYQFLFSLITIQLCILFCKQSLLNLTLWTFNLETSE